METHGIMKAFPKVKRHRSNETKDAPAVKKPSGLPITGNIFQGVCIHIVPVGIGNARRDIFQQQIVQNGGQVEAAYGPSCTHVVVDESVDRERASRLLKMETFPPAVQLVKCTWLSACITEKKLVSTEDYSLQKCDRPQDAPAEKPKLSVVSCIPVPEEKQPPDHKSAQDDPADMVPETQEEPLEEDAVSQNDLEALISGVKHDPGTSEASEKTEVLGKWVCAQSSRTKSKNHNDHITDKLEQLAKAYTHMGDKWRALSYSKAINALKSHPKAITSYEEAYKIQGIGKSMANKIVEIMESGHLRKLDQFGEAMPVLETFTNIWGVGAKTAKLWYQQGFRTLEDIRTKATLTHTLRIGLKHYDDFLDRMPRSEAAAIEKTVREAAHSVNPELLVVACGSYRRGKPTCGDVDVLITHPDGQSHKGVFSKVLQVLHQSGFLTDDLVSHEDNGEQKKYMGVCVLPGSGQRHRRLDIIVVPHDEFACALLYFTGSAHFNRSMRALAKTKSMSLSEHSLTAGVVRERGVKVVPGLPLSTPTERAVFEHLGIPYREAHERDW
ncbi:DNA polymerase lambda isoform X1 [Tachysurus fulvidraco]|uniref:DNA polymerase lambda isoform X1 n=1 Tax=Tachysurus fulvidraco TaxID=1234273 RepID=UPI000F5146A1|nr:DNA polymerase lambda isoform X1 [Tachysurus fulvidraco]XP_027035070.1 DNA polymerase lambda isoform X1 [Tachysurus fulvidraco]